MPNTVTPTPQQQIALWVIPILLVLYVSPIWMVAVGSWFGALNGDQPLGKWFVALIANPDSALNLLHKVFLPISAFITVGLVWDGAGRRWIIGVVTFLLISIGLSLYVYVLLCIPDFRQNLWQSAGNDAVSSSGAVLTLGTSLITRIQETAATYLLTLLGVQVAAATAAKAA